MDGWIFWALPKIWNMDFSPSAKNLDPNFPPLGQESGILIPSLQADDVPRHARAAGRRAERLQHRGVAHGRDLDVVHLHMNWNRGLVPKIWVNMDWIRGVCAKNMGKYGLD